VAISSPSNLSSSKKDYESKDDEITNLCEVHQVQLVSEVSVVHQAQTDLQASEADQVLWVSEVLEVQKVKEAAWVLQVIVVKGVLICEANQVQLVSKVQWDLQACLFLDHQVKTVYRVLEAQSVLGVTKVIWELKVRATTPTVSFHQRFKLQKLSKGIPMHFQNLLKTMTRTNINRLFEAKNPDTKLTSKMYDRLRYLVIFIRPIIQSVIRINKFLDKQKILFINFNDFYFTKTISRTINLKNLMKRMQFITKK